MTSCPENNCDFVAPIDGDDFSATISARLHQLGHCAAKQLASNSEVSVDTLQRLADLEQAPKTRSSLYRDYPNTIPGSTSDSDRQLEPAA